MALLPELWEIIIGFLPHKTLIKMNQISKQLNKDININTILIQRRMNYPRHSK